MRSKLAARSANYPSISSRLTANCGPQILLADIMMRLESMLRVLTNEGFGPLEQAYTDSWLHTGQHVSAHGSVSADPCKLRVAESLALM